MPQPDDQNIKSTIASDSVERSSDQPSNSWLTGQSIPTDVQADLGVSESLPPQSVIGRYKLEERLGSGSYGVVYRASDTTLRRSVAIKLLTRFENEQEIDGWLSEARVLAGLDHPSIVTVYDIGRTTASQPYIVSKLIGGGTLSKRLSVGRIDTRQVVAWVLQLAEALDYLHLRHVMHRDIKPGNILLTDDDRAVLADFGLALPEERFGKGAKFVGTPAYMSPEQARREGHRVDGRSDIYSLGVVFYEMLTGQRPFRANNQDELLDCIRTVEVRPLRQLVSDIPRELERICLKMLSKKVVERYATAGDMAEELRAWAQGSQVPAGTTKIVTTESGSAVESAARSTELGNIIVVPHGLRPFDSHDADFFKFLLPGARDRYGIPDSVSFWSSRILSRQANDTFRVGVLLGPSGSGKSSLVRAGILPLVSHNVHPVFIEAKPEGLEASLLKQVVHRLPHLREEETLVDALIRFRQTPSDSQEMKLLIVIDQFEQWLNTHRSGQWTQLHEAMRQCDGVHLQALLLVRDDFMLGLSNFMDEIEEPIQQNKNFATMERFGPSHMRSVLAAFGRAYGALGEVISSEQDAFLETVVDELSRAGNFEPVHLALLTEMIKDKPWNRATFRALGGIQGLGISFLEQRLAGPTAHPFLRSEIQTVRRVLSELLPPDDTVIKPQPCTEQLLIERIGSMASGETIDKILNLLDTEVRLITPTSSAPSTGSAVGSTASHSSVVPAFQLTHDYLVPTIRKWLTAAEGGTHAGRVRVLLRDLAVSWNAARTHKRLPSLSEWLSIRIFTRPANWTAIERLMMRTLERRIGLYGLAILGTLAVIGFVYDQANRQRRIETLATRLMEADTSRVAAVLSSMGRYRPSVAQSLRATTERSIASLTPQQRLHLALLNLEQSESQSWVVEQLDHVDDAQLLPIIDYVWQRYRSEKLQELLPVLKKAIQTRQASSLNVLPQTALLARLDTEAASQPDMLQQLSNQLAVKSPLDIAHWPELLKPLGEPLVAELLRVANAGKLSSQAADNYLSLIQALAPDNVSALANCVGWAPLERMKRIIEQTQDRSKLAVALRQRLSQLRNPFSQDTAQAIDPDLGKQLAAFDGLVKPNCAWAETIPWDKMHACIDALARHGYCPMCVRPYRDTSEGKGSPLLVAIVWHKSKVKPVLKTGMSFEELVNQFEEYKAQNKRLFDLARYEVNGAWQWLGLWHEVADGAKVSPQKLSLEDLFTGDDDSRLSDEELKYHVVRYVDWLDEKGDVQTLNLFEYGEQPMRSVTWSRVGRANGDRYPNCRIYDLRSQVTFDQSDRGALWHDIHYYLEDWRAGKELPALRVAGLARRLLAAAQTELAGEVLQSLTDDRLAKEPAGRQSDLKTTILGLRIHQTLQAGQINDAQSHLTQLLADEAASSIDKVYWQTRVALASGGVSAIDPKWLDELAQATSKKKEDEVKYLKVLALIAAKVPDSVSAGELGIAADSPLLNKVTGAIAELLSRAREALDNDRLGLVFLESEFDGLRARPAWRSLMQAQQLTERWAVASVSDANINALVNFPDSSIVHAQRASSFYARGYLPVAWHVTNQSGQRKTMSVWHRPLRSTVDLALQAESMAKLALALVHLGEVDALQDALAEQSGRGLATYVALNACKTIPADALVALLKSTTSKKVQVNALIALGNYVPAQLKADDLEYLQLRLRDWASGTQLVTLMNHAQWCLKQLKLPLPEVTSAVDASVYLANKNQEHEKSDWFINTLGQQLVVISADDLIGMGSDYKRVWVKLKRQYAITATEVTGAQMQKFWADPRVQQWIARQKSERRVEEAEGDLPQSRVSWVMAVMYAQWLNERENIPPDQWCYRNVFNEDDSLPIPEPNYLQRTGYRLPTFAEWVVASQSSSTEQWHFGCDIRAANQFEWTQSNSGEELHPVAQLLPNFFGLYDTGGNLVEWTDTVFQPPLRGPERYWIVDGENDEIKFSSFAYQMGGRFTQSPSVMSHRNSKVNLISYLSATSGFRLARTVR